MVKLYKEAKERLSAVTPDSAFEANVIFGAVLGSDWRLKELRGDISLSAKEREDIESLISRRLSGEPLQYAVGEWEFYGIPLRVGPGALIPRQDTETLAETALKLIADINRPRVLDLCSGTGCAAFAIKKMRPDAEVTALEKYIPAYEILLSNIERYSGVFDVRPVLADALDWRIAENFRELDLITANPPYLTDEDMANLQPEVRYEPKTALFGGSDGLTFYRELPKVWYGSLKSGGAMTFEIGLGQQNSVSGLLEEAGFRNIGAEKDPTGRIRVVYGIKK